MTLSFDVRTVNRYICLRREGEGEGRGGGGGGGERGRGRGEGEGEERGGDFALGRKLTQTSKHMQKVLSLSYAKMNRKPWIPCTPIPCTPIPCTPIEKTALEKMMAICHLHIFNSTAADISNSITLHW